MAVLANGAPPDRSLIVGKSTNAAARKSRAPASAATMQPHQPIGYMLYCITSLCKLYEVPQHMRRYEQAVINLKRLRLISSLYQRPAAFDPYDVTEMHRCGCYTKVPVCERLVCSEKAQSDPWLHLAEASRLRFPRRSAIAKIGSIHWEAAYCLAQMEEASIAPSRQMWMQAFHDALAPLGEFNAYLRSFAPETLKPILGSINIASIGAIAESLAWSDVKICQRVLFGAPIVDGDEPIDDTGLFRPITKAGMYSLWALRRGFARPFRYIWRGGQADVEYDAALPGNTAYFNQCAHATGKSAKDALAAAGISREDARDAMRSHCRDSKQAIPNLLKRAKSETARRRLRRMLDCETISRKETKEGKATAPQPELSFRQTAADTMGGIDNVRVSRRHVVYRGKRPDGTEKPRAVDDCRHSNGAATTYETVDMPSFMWIIWMACILALHCARKSWARRGYIALPRMYCGLDDMAAAYRVVSAAWWPCVGYFCWWSFLSMSMVVQRAYGHLFGMKAANNNYSRVPRLACVAAVTFMLVLTWHYVDDHLYLDLAAGGQTAMDSLALVYNEMGWELEMSKRKHMGLSNIALGARTDLSRVQQGFATISPDAEKVEENLQALRRLRERGVCRAADAEQIVGRWRWATSQVFSRVGTAALQPFAQRAAGRDGNAIAWTEAMTSALSFLELIFDSDYRPQLEINLLEQVDRDGAPASDDDACLIVYTDAEHDMVDGTPTGMAAYHIYDQRDGVHYSGNISITSDFNAMLKPGRGSYIGQYEEAGLIGAVYTKPLLFKDRKVIFFCDNAGSLSHFVNGYAGEPDSAALVNMFHVAILALNIEWWGEWVPSKANPADLRTRPDRFAEFYLAMEGVPLIEEAMVLPPLDLGDARLREWMELIQARARGE